MASTKTVYVPAAYYTGWIYTCPNAESLSDIYRGCAGETIETGLSSVDGYYSVSVSGTGVAEGVSANLTINDSYEGSQANNGTQIEFFAFYVNSTNGDPITDGSCNVTFDDNPGTWYEMIWNITGNSGYNYNKTSGFVDAGLHVWNVTCAHVDFDKLNATDNVTVIVPSQPVGGTAIPEFSDYAIALILLTVISGFFIVKKKETG